MKEYISNRVREAAMIVEIVEGPGQYLLKLEGGESATVPMQYIDKHQPTVGGYYVRYIDDGYESFCPGDVFEAGNVEFPDAPPPEAAGIDAVILPNESFSGDVVGVSREDESTEAMIAAAGLNAPRVVPDTLVERINTVAFYRLSERTTICEVTLVNGYTVRGESVCVSPENFNWEIGKKISLENAVREILPLEGYLLKQNLHEGCAKGEALQLRPRQSGRPFNSKRGMEMKDKMREEFEEFKQSRKGSIPSGEIWRVAWQTALTQQPENLAPGVMRCAKCDFQMIRNNLNFNAGTVTAGDSKTEPCPNGCGPLWPVTWKQRAQELEDMVERWGVRLHNSR